MNYEGRLAAQTLALGAAAAKVEDGFRFKLTDISKNLKDYPNLTKEPFASRLKEWEENATKHILQTYSAVTKSLASYSHSFDKVMNRNPELAALFKEGEDFHNESQAREIRENPNTKIRTKPYTW